MWSCWAASPAAPRHDPRRCQERPAAAPGTARGCAVRRCAAPRPSGSTAPRMTVCGHRTEENPGNRRFRLGSSTTNGTSLRTGPTDSHALFRPAGQERAGKVESDRAVSGHEEKGLGHEESGDMKRAGDGNRTRVIGLGSRSFTIKLRPRVTVDEQLSVQVDPCADTLPSATRTSLQPHGENASPRRTACAPQTRHDTRHAILREPPHTRHAILLRTRKRQPSEHALRGGRSRPSVRHLPSPQRVAPRRSQRWAVGWTQCSTASSAPNPV